MRAHFRVKNKEVPSSSPASPGRKKAPAHWCRRWGLLAIENQKLLTVMGPGKDGTPERGALVPRKPDEAPPLFAGADRLRWRKAVAAWVSYITRRAAAGEKICKSHAATLSDLLFAAVHHSYQKVIELAKADGLDFSVPTAEQPAVVLRMVRLIGYDTPVEVTSRLLAAYKAVHACVRYPNETLDKFATRYRGCASHYMELAHASIDSQDSQLLAMVLLENAHLTQDAMQSAKLQLVQQAQQRSLHSPQKQMPAIAPSLSKCSEMLSALQSLSPISEGSGSDSDETHYTLTAEQHQFMNSGVQEIKNALLSWTTVSYELTDPAAESPTPSFLQDAVIVLQNMYSQDTRPKRDAYQETPNSLAAELNSLKKSMTTLLASHAGISVGSRSTDAGTEQVKAAKKRTRCHDCNRFGHWKGDVECPSKKRLHRPVAVNTGGNKEGSRPTDTDGASSLQDHARSFH
jgi:hypothetical protein